MLAGAVLAVLRCGGGALGVGVAYPLDTIKVKVQAASSRRAIATAAPASGSSSTFQLAADLVREDGLEALYGGVSAAMVGQAFIKGAAFFAYDGPTLAGCDAEPTRTEVCAEVDGLAEALEKATAALRNDTEGAIRAVVDGAMWI